MEFTDREKRLLKTAESYRRPSALYYIFGALAMIPGFVVVVTASPRSPKDFLFGLMCVLWALLLCSFRILLGDACSVIQKLKQEVGAPLSEEQK